MTTDARQYEIDLHRRQRALGIFVLVLAFLTVGVSIHSIREDARQRDCLEKAFSELNDNLQVRLLIGKRDSQAKTDVILAASEARTPEDYELAFENFKVEQTKIDKMRSENPLPPFPEGKCN